MKDAKGQAMAASYKAMPDVSDKQAADALAGGGAKSAGVPVHPSMNASTYPDQNYNRLGQRRDSPEGQSYANKTPSERATIQSPTYAQSVEGQKKFGPFAEAVSGFREKYGSPRDLKAEARGFASGKREINRLKRQGK